MVFFFGAGSGEVHMYAFVNLDLRGCQESSFLLALAGLAVKVPGDVGRYCRTRYFTRRIVAVR